LPSQDSGITRHRRHSGDHQATRRDGSGIPDNSLLTCDNTSPHVPLNDERRDETNTSTPLPRSRGFARRFPRSERDLAPDLPVWVAWWPCSGLSWWPLGAWAACRSGCQQALDAVGTGPITGPGYVRTAGSTGPGYLGPVARPNMDRVEIKVWVTRSAARRLAAQAAERGVSRSAYARELLSGEPVPAATALVVVDKHEPHAVAAPRGGAATSSGCHRCGCAVTRDAIRWGACEDCGPPAPRPPLTAGLRIRCPPHRCRSRGTGARGEPGRASPDRGSGGQAA
jgi:hypothetical protein